LGRVTTTTKIPDRALPIRGRLASPWTSQTGCNRCSKCLRWPSRSWRTAGARGGGTKASPPVDVREITFNFLDWLDGDSWTETINDYSRRPWLYKTEQSACCEVLTSGLRQRTGKPIARARPKSASLISLRLRWIS